MSRADEQSRPVVHPARLKDHYVLTDSQIGLLFDRESMRVWPVPPDVANVLSTTLSNLVDFSEEGGAAQAVSKIIQAYHDAPDPNLLAGLRAERDDSPHLRDAVSEDRYLGKLAINIANDCNLGCTYCYANGGFYETPARIWLSPVDCENIVRRFANRFDYIESVQFMGGEPSLNIEAIAQCGQVFARLVREGSLAAMPIFQLVTNALVLSTRFLDLCVEYGIELTVSLDGPAEVHDSVRVRKNGRGSYTQVRKSVDRALARNIRIGFEPTFSRAHLENGVSLIHLCEWFYDEFGIDTLHAPPVSSNTYADPSTLLTNDEKMRQYCAVTEWGVDNLLIRRRRILHDFTARIVDALAARTRSSMICPAGNSQVSVSVKGELSPCWMYTDDPNYVIGHVEEDQLITDKGWSVLQKMQAAELHSHPDCRACMIQPVCFGCKGADYHSTGTFTGKTNCDFMRAMVATTLMRIFSHEDVPGTVDGYLDRTTYGELIYTRLRPQTAAPVPSAGPQPTFIPLSELRRRVEDPNA